MQAEHSAAPIAAFDPEHEDDLSHPLDPFEADLTQFGEVSNFEWLLAERARRRKKGEPVEVRKFNGGGRFVLVRLRATLRILQ